MVPEAGRREGKDLEAPLRLEIVSALMSALLRAQAAYEDIYQIHRPRNFLAVMLREANLQAVPLHARPPGYACDDAEQSTVLRPVSMRSLAESLHVPVQTCHEALESLCDAGVLRKTAAGYLVDYSGETAARFEEADRRAYQIFYDLLAEGWIDQHWADIREAMPAPVASLPSWQVLMGVRPWLRWVCRIFEIYSPMFGDPQSIAVSAAVMVLQRRSMGDRRTGGAAGGRGPKVSSLGVAQITTMPRETVRRRLHDLAARGLVTKGERGWRFSLALREGDTLSLARLEPFLGSFARLATELRTVSAALKEHALLNGAAIDD